MNALKLPSILCSNLLGVGMAAVGSLAEGVGLQEVSLPDLPLS